MPTQSLTLADALPLEIARCKELIKQYYAIGPAGAFGIMMIQRDIDAAEKATQEQDTVGMLRAYERLRECR